MSLKSWIIKKLAGVTPAHFHQFTDQLLDIIEDSDAAVVLRSEQRLPAGHYTKPVIVIGQQMILLESGTTINTKENRPAIIASPLAREWRADGITVQCEGFGILGAPVD